MPRRLHGRSRFDGQAGDALPSRCRLCTGAWHASTERLGLGFAFLPASDDSAEFRKNVKNWRS
jgi:hypothetical protein